ncbi:hypothetical protein XBJ2_150003 [Xenorhabdus bovienii str. Jollieti]|uniref:Uncharacterized protein n=1 Tax=Xenorhabdus bovienii (strain SS-2004) TaxID=406818 RepID=D3UWA5_XENBS|nr:hypothetical protein XBJ1_0465 [Xenorhabdus bovienii SS-2004]CDH27746.1 hypothetical protein XBJ2_150003 [Xenorhabdus bovienii str. Jollieti]
MNDLTHLASCLLIVDKIVILEQPLSHEEVIETAEKVKATFLKLVVETISRF